MNTKSVLAPYWCDLFALHREIKKEKDKYRLDFLSEEVRCMRSHMNKESSFDTILYRKNSYDSGYTIIYKDLFFFEGTKEEALEELWRYYAERICSDYDCTGKRFTTNFKIGKVKPGLWKVAETFGIDV